jgi:outer membrane receptor protein involved in Fe transport
MVPGYVAAQGMLEEVIVTAQKREQNLQDVPISVQAFTGEALAESGIKDVFDLQANAPGLQVNQSQNATTSNFAIRGIGTGGNNFGFESSVGLYVDGVYRSRQSSMINQLVDIQSVDILRGPQGTLFGRNSLSGAIQFTTVKPDHDGSGFGEVTLGNYGLMNLSGAISISAIEDVLAFRVTGFSSEREGYVENLALPGSDDINDRDRYGFRAQALWTPSEDLTVHVIADYAELDELCCGSTVWYDNNRIDQRLFADNLDIGSDSFLEGKGGTFISQSRVFDDVQAHSINPESSSEDVGISAQIDWNIEDYTVTSITAYREFDSTDLIDADFTDLDALTDNNIAEQSQFSQELRLTYIGEDFNYVVGANYFRQTLDSTSTLDFGEETELFAFYSQGFGVDTLTTDALAGSFFDPNGFASDVNEQTHESWAVFAQGDYNLTDALVLTAGIRYSDENKELSTLYTDSGGAFLGFTSGRFDPTNRRDDVDETITDEQVTGTLKLSWFATDDIMLYGSYSTGYKAGGTNTDRINTAFPQVFDAETSSSIELGMKAEFPDQGLRLNVAIYQSDIDDQQVGSFAGDSFNVQNADVDTYGGEIEILWQATESTTINAAYAKTIADFDKFEKGNCWTVTPFRTGVADPGAKIQEADGSVRLPVTEAESFDPTFCDRSGGRLADNPEDSLILGIRQEFNISDSILAFGLLEYSYKGDSFINASNDPLTLQDSYNTVNLRLGMLFEDYQTEITLWGRNVTDEEYLATSFDSVLQTGKQGAYIREPATYGITFNKKF